MKRNETLPARYQVHRSKIEPNSFNVVCLGRLNEWGEPWIEIPLLTEHEAEAVAAKMNSEAEKLNGAIHNAARKETR